MSKIAVIKTGGKQYLVKKGDKLKVEKLKAVNDENIEFETLMTSEEDGKGLQLGKSVLSVKVKAKVLGQGKSKKVRVVHYKAKTRQHKVYGHKQPYSEAEILSV